MSLITDDPEESPRDCSRSRKHNHHHHGGGRSGSSGRRRALIAASSTAVSLLLLAIILWLTIRPSSPHFSLLAATATATNNASAIVVDAAFTARNPNDHAAALYDRLQASASYAGVTLSAGAPLPPLDQPAEGDVVLSALLTTSSSTAAVAVGGRALLRVRIEGQLRWKVAAWVSGRHGLEVDCIAAVLLQASPSPRIAVDAAQGSSSSSQCATHVL